MDIKIYFIRKSNCEACTIALKNIIAVLDELELKNVDLVITKDTNRFDVKEFPTTIVISKDTTKRVAGSFSKECFKEILKL